MNYYKGNLHMHTTRSDGAYTPEAALDLYRAAGYDFVALTDHYEYGEGFVAPNGLLVLSGAEYDIGTDAINEGIYHIAAFGMKRDPGMTRDRKPPVQEIIDRVHAAGGLAALAHPAWSLNTPEQMAALRGVDMTEIFNTFSDRPWNCRPYSGNVLDLLALRGVFFPLSAVDDTHFYQGEQCRSYVMVRAEECTSDAIISALGRGDFFATQGPTFECSVRLDGDGTGVIAVDCSPVERVTFFTDRAYTPDRCVCGHGLTHAEYRIKPGDRFARFELEDANGDFAWSSYVFVRL